MSPGKLRLAWRVAVGAAIDRVTTVSMDDHKVVQVVAPDATWRRELKRSQALILSRLRDLVGADEVASVKILGKSGKE
jgi:predicted nucleic acid-binding Zn ribbon protein